MFIIINKIVTYRLYNTVKNEKLADVEILCVVIQCHIKLVPIVHRNAIVHGNGNDKRKKVRIACQQEQDKLVFSVADEGNGFPFNTYKENGRHLETHGLSAIFAICEEVRFQQNGSVIAFTIPIRTRQPVPQHHIDLQTMETSVLNTL